MFGRFFSNPAWMLKIFYKMHKAQYTRQAMQEMKDNFFDGSTSSLVKFFVNEEILSADEIREILSMVSCFSCARIRTFVSTAQRC